MSSISPGDTLIVHVTRESRIADGLCMGGFTNVSGIPVTDVPDIPIHVRGDIESDLWYEVSVVKMRSASIIAEAKHQVSGRSGDLVEESTDESGKVWIVDSAGSECYHTTRSCEMIKKSQGELLPVETGSRDTPLPNMISDMRRCNYCH